MFPVINPLYLWVFLDFRTQYSKEIYSRETLSLLQVILGGEGARITTICRPDVRADYTGISPVFDDIDIEIVQIATQECLTTGRPLVLPESLQWRYEFTLFFGILFTRYEPATSIKKVHAHKKTTRKGIPNTNRTITNTNIVIRPFLNPKLYV